MTFKNIPPQATHLPEWVRRDLGISLGETPCFWLSEESEGYPETGDGYKEASAIHGPLPVAVPVQEETSPGYSRPIEGRKLILPVHTDQGIIFPLNVTRRISGREEVEWSFPQFFHSTHPCAVLEVQDGNVLSCSYEQVGLARERRVSWYLGQGEWSTPLR